MQRAINPAIFVNTLAVFGERIIEASGKLAKRDFVRRVAINFIGAHKYKYRFRTMLARGFRRSLCPRHSRQNQAGRYPGPYRGTVSRAMDDQVETVFLKLSDEALAITNVEIAMFET